MISDFGFRNSDSTSDSPIRNPKSEIRNSRVVWITGGATGIGRALAQACLDRGDHVALSGRRAELLEAAARELDPRGTRVMALAGDVTSLSFAPRTLAAITARWGAVDLLINNAGSNDNRSFSEVEAIHFQDAFAANCLGAVQCAQAVLPAMKARRRGTIVNISSIYGRWASSNSPTYSVAKYALTGFTDSLRQSLMGTGIRVMAVYPGFIRTDMTMPHVKPGSLKSRMGAKPESIARAILNAADSRRRELYYPFYVSWVIRFYRWFPGVMDRVAASFRGKSETQH